MAFAGMPAPRQSAWMAAAMSVESPASRRGREPDTDDGDSCAVPGLACGPGFAALKGRVDRCQGLAPAASLLPGVTSSVLSSSSDFTPLRAFALSERLPGDLIGWP